MKKTLALGISLLFAIQGFAQNEGRIGFFTGMNNTQLLNADDKAYGDYLPTFKPTIGLDATYHFTMFKTIASGIGVEMSYNQLGQNYRGAYDDKTSYFAYSRLNYMRMGLQYHLGTPLRKSVAVSYAAGLSYGLLSSYQDRYELVRYDNSRYILDVKNSNVDIIDSSTVKGKLGAPLYKKTDLTFSNKLGVDFLVGENLVFSVYARYDMGLQGVENLTKNSITLATTPTTTQEYQPAYLKVKYRTPIATTIARNETTNNFAGVYLALHYRIWNKDKTEFWYKQRQRKFK